MQASVITFVLGSENHIFLSENYVEKHRQKQQFTIDQMR